MGESSAGGFGRSRVEGTEVVIHHQVSMIASPGVTAINRADPSHFAYAMLALAGGSRPQIGLNYSVILLFLASTAQAQKRFCVR